MGCCYSCSHWEDVSEKTVGGEDRNIPIRQWYCHHADRPMKPWDSLDCYEPRFTNKEYDEESDEAVEVGYLACWLENVGCSFKEECYRENSTYFV